MTVIRPATLKDDAAIATVHLSSWQAHFSQFLSEDLIALKNLDEARELEKWQGRLGKEEGKTRWTFLAIQEGAAVAYVTGGEDTSDTSGYDTELYQIYLLPEVQQQGLGKRLVSVLAKQLAVKGFQALLVWVMTANHAIKFYRDGLGGKDINLIRTILEAKDTDLREAAYGWPDLRQLIRENL